MHFEAFQDDTASATIDNLTFENQIERLSIYGSIQIYKDQQGLAYAKQLLTLLNQTVHYLEKQDLPEKYPQNISTEEVDNPFWDDK